jgi:O-antigen/teichoic acid export membrane protein
MKGLKGHSVRGGGVTLISQGIKFILNLISTMTLARILVPSDFGLVAMVSVILNFVSLFKDLGLSMATIQKTEINHQQVSALFWVNVAISLLLILILFLSAPFLALFFHEPRLLKITMVLACTFLFSGLTVQHQALLRRQMKFFALGLIEIGSMAAGVLGAIVIAISGAGYWALVGMPLLSAITNVILVWFFCKWRPGRLLRGTGARSFLKFGSHLTGFSLINYFSRNLDNILIGRFWGAEYLGYYSKAYNLMMLPILQVRGPLESVAIPGLSRLRNHPERYKRYYLKLIGVVAFISMPLMVILFVCAEEVILIVLGSNWMKAVDIFRVLCLIAFIQPVSTTRGLVLISLGQSHKYLKLGIAISILTSISFILGLHWGTIGVASAYVLVNYIILFPSLWYCFCESPIKTFDFLKEVVRPILVSLIMGLSIFFVRMYMIYKLQMNSILITIFIGLLVYFIVWNIIPSGNQYLRELLAYKKSLFEKNK